MEMKEYVYKCEPIHMKAWKCTVVCNQSVWNQLLFLYFFLKKGFHNILLQY